MAFFKFKNPFNRKFEPPVPTPSSYNNMYNRPVWAMSPGRVWNYAKEVGELASNSAVAACMNFITRTLPESPIVVLDKAGKVLPNHKLTRLLASPVDMTEEELISSVVSSAYLYGNSYIRKIRGANNRVVALEFIPTNQVSVELGKDLRPLKFKTNNWGILTTDEVVHVRGLVSPDNPWMGRSYFYSCLREICTDNEAAAYEASMLRNLGIPGVILTSDDGSEIPPDAAEEIKQKYIDKTTGERRGEPLIIPGKMKVTQLGFSPVQMSTETLSKRPEERICAALGLSPIVVGLGAGLSTSTYNNMKQAHEAAFENCIIPMGKKLASDFGRSLLIDTGDPVNESVVYDYSNAAALQDDQAAKMDLLVQAVGSGIYTVNEAREALGMTPIGGQSTQ